jgi:predicted nucleic acid-binding protein
MAEKPRVLLDANVLIAGTIWPRWQYEILRHTLMRDYHLVLSPLVIESARRNIHRIDPAQLYRFEQFLADCPLEVVDNPSLQQVRDNIDLVRDASDVPIALAAINAGVDYLVTYDDDFTSNDETAEKVREAIPGIILPPVFLRDVLGWTSEQLEQIRARNWEEIN